MILGEFKCDDYDNYIIHFTHNDADALGCSVLLNLYAEFACKDRTKVINIFNTASGIDDSINNFVEFMKDDTTIKFRDFVINKHNINSIFITDVGPKKETIDDLVSTMNSIYDGEDDYLQFLGFDHHTTNDLNKYYNWFTVSPTDLIQRTGHLTNRVVSIDDIPVSATYLLYKYINTSKIFSISAMSMIDLFVIDISMYDTWLWKTNPIYEGSKRQDRTQKLINIMGIKYTTEIITDNIVNYIKEPPKQPTKCISSDALVYNIFKNVYMCETPVYDYIPSKFMAAYELSKIRSLKAIKKSLYTVKCINYKDQQDSIVSVLNFSDLFGDNISLFKDKDTLATVYFTIHDSDDDIGELATFINSYLHKEVYNNNECIYIHIFPRSLTVSFRSEYFDVSYIAKALGGGGHKSASGAKIHPEVMINLMSKFYDPNILFLSQIDIITKSFNIAYNKYKNNIAHLNTVDPDKVM